IMMMNPSAWESVGTQVFSTGQNYVEQTMKNADVWNRFRYYWNVDNGYVLSKLLLLIFPFKQKNWDRLVVRNDATGEVQGYKPPRYDVMAADLYIPVMAFVSYILLVGAKMGATRKFTPEVLTVTASSALFVTCINVLFLRLGLYLLNISMDQQGLQLSDLVSYSSYQYVLICILECLSFFVVSGATNDGLFTVFKVLVFVYMSVALSWFVLKSLRRVIVSTTNASYSSSTAAAAAVVNDGFQQQQNRKPRAYFLFVFVMLQVVSMWWL
ncbi:hypothetical protein MP638_004515, partial [Amoeboaphelidium occidentale]